MPETPTHDAETADSGPGNLVWRKRVAVLVAVALAAAGLMLLERNPASAASVPHVVRTSRVAAHQAAVASAEVAHLKAVSSQLRGTASVLTQTLPSLDATTAASTADVADSATKAAGLSQQLASIVTSPAASTAAQTSATAAGANSTAGQLEAALATTQAKAAAATRLPITLPIKFCNFTIQIGPIIINIPRFHIHIVIGPFFIRFRAPCFLSGIIPTHLPR